MMLSFPICLTCWNQFSESEDPVKGSGYIILHLLLFIVFFLPVAKGGSLAACGQTGVAPYGSRSPTEAQPPISLSKLFISAHGARGCV